MSAGVVVHDSMIVMRGINEVEGPTMMLMRPTIHDLIDEYLNPRCHPLFVVVFVVVVTIIGHFLIPS